MKSYQSVLLDKLEELDKLKERSAISEESYEKKKAKYTEALREEDSDKGKAANKVTATIVTIFVAIPILLIAWIIINMMMQA